ncbi:MAG: ABC transporter ATP-binding protein [Planctomycetaceae bacterium]|nr:MAG: ABC transporter ATP-binding protein [Planctomycetaceae bacterium]
MVEFKNVTKIYDGPEGKVAALDRVSLSVQPGEFLAVCGPSGCGKTTLLLTAGGLLRPSDGQMSLDGQDPYVLSPEMRSRLRARMIGFVFQQFHLIPYLTVRQNILAPSLAFPTKEADQRAQELVSRFGLDERAGHVPAQISTGQRQRTALARALLNKPKIILADEPTGNLDEGNANIVLGYLSQYVAEGGCVLLVTHDVRTAAHATRSLQMSQGKLVE